MTDYELINLLGRAFAFGEADALEEHLASDCEYHSDYADVTVTTAEKIISRMKKVHGNVTEECKYSYETVPLDDVLQGINHENLNTIEGIHINEYGLLLFQYDANHPVAVVSVMLDDQD